MGYRHDRVTVAPGVANDSKASWRLLGNTIQRAALEHVCAPFLDGLEELRDQMSERLVGPAPPSLPRAISPSFRNLLT